MYALLPIMNKLIGLDNSGLPKSSSDKFNLESMSKTTISFCYKSETYALFPTMKMPKGKVKSAIPKSSSGKFAPVAISKTMTSVE